MDSKILLEQIGPIYGIKPLAWWGNPFFVTSVCLLFLLFVACICMFFVYRSRSWHAWCAWSVHDYISGLLAAVQEPNASSVALYSGACMCVKYFYEHTDNVPARAYTDREFLLFLKEKEDDAALSDIRVCFEHARQARFAGVFFDQSVVLSDLQRVQSFLDLRSETVRT